MKHILLINPPYSPYTPRESAIPPLGLARLATEAAKHSDVKVLDMGVEEAAGLDSSISLEDLLRKFQPQIIGIGPLVSSNVRKASDITRYIRNRLPNAMIIWGGPDPSAAFETRLRECDALDAIAVGEADFAFPELLKHYENRNISIKIKGLAIRRDGTVNYESQERISTTFLTKLSPPDWSFFPLNLYRKVAHDSNFTPYLPVEVGRGCPYNCTFCAAGTMFGHVRRQRPVRAIVKDLQDAVTRFRYTRFVFNTDFRRPHMI